MLSQHVMTGGIHTYNVTLTVVQYLLLFLCVIYCVAETLVGFYQHLYCILCLLHHSGDVLYVWTSPDIVIIINLSLCIW